VKIGQPWRTVYGEAKKRKKENKKRKSQTVIFHACIVILLPEYLIIQLLTKTVTILSNVVPDPKLQTLEVLAPT